MNKSRNNLSTRLIALVSMARSAHWAAKVVAVLLLASVVVSAMALLHREPPLPAPSSLTLASDLSMYFPDPQVAAFADAVQRGDLLAVRFGLAAGVSANARGRGGYRPIHFAFTAPTTAVLRVLLDAEADPNARLANGDTPLHLSVRAALPEFTDLLLSRKANPRAVGGGGEPVIHTALVHPDPRVLGLLVRSGADPNQAWGENTPLMAAVKAPLWDSAEALLRLGADSSWKNEEGETVASHLCDSIRRSQPTQRNRLKIASIVDSFSESGVTLRCQADVARFLQSPGANPSANVVVTLGGSA